MPALAESLERVHALVARIGEEHPDVGELDLMMFETAVVEIAGNVIEHGHPAGQVTMTLEASVTDDELTAFLHETGEPLPAAPSYAMPGADAESGRGLPLCAAVLDTFEYDRVESGNVWELRRRRTRT